MKPTRQRVQIPQRTTADVIPVVDLTSFIVANDQGQMDAQATVAIGQVTNALRRYGMVVVRDPRLPVDAIDRGKTMVGRFFASDLAFKQRFEVSNHQIEWTDGDVEKSYIPRRIARRIPRHFLPPKIRYRDPKGRWFQPLKIKQRPVRTRYRLLNLAEEVREPFSGWNEATNAWGDGLFATGFTVNQMLERGLGLKPGDLTKGLQNGPHLFAPTGMEVTSHSEFYEGDEGDIIAGPHTDLGALSVHTGSFLYDPETGEIIACGGLIVWTAEGEPLLVKVPPGCVLLQVAQELEWLTGGALFCGLHTVIVTPEMHKLIVEARAQGRRLIRCSSTVFMHWATDRHLRPLRHFNTPKARRLYPRRYKGAVMNNELRKIALAA